MVLNPKCEKGGISGEERGSICCRRNRGFWAFFSGSRTFLTNRPLRRWLEDVRLPPILLRGHTTAYKANQSANRRLLFLSVATGSSLSVPADTLSHGCQPIYCAKTPQLFPKTCYTCDYFCLFTKAERSLTTYLPTDRENQPAGYPVGLRAVQLAWFSVLSRSFSAATSVLISLIIAASSLSHSSSVPA